MTPLVAETGDIYYELKQDFLSEIPSASVIVPASEIIHDMMPSLWHPLIPHDNKSRSPLFSDRRQNGRSHRRNLGRFTLRLKTANC